MSPDPHPVHLCPDLILKIFDLCPPSALSSCSLTCRAWRDPTQSLLTRSIAWPRPDPMYFSGNGEQRHIIRMSLVQDRDARKRLLSYIRVLSVTIMDTEPSHILDDFVESWPLMERLQELQLRIMDKRQLGDERWTHVCSVLSAQHTQLRKVCIRPIAVLERLPAHQVLELSRACPATVTELCINQGRDECYSEMEPVADPDIDESSWPLPATLRKIVLHECSQTSYFLNAILKRPFVRSTFYYRRPSQLQNFRRRKLLFFHQYAGFVPRDYQRQRRSWPLWSTGRNRGSKRRTQRRRLERSDQLHPQNPRRPSQHDKLQYPRRPKRRTRPPTSL